MVSSSKAQQRTLCTDTLQQLVLEHLQHLDKLQQPISETAGSVTEAALASIRQAIVDGNINQAIDMVHTIDPSLLGADNPTLLFELKLQAWIELLRANRHNPSTMLPSALAWLRTELAPLALGAHPETYQRFQAALPLLLSCTDDAPSGVEAQPLEGHWSLRRRLLCASTLELTLRNRHNVLGSTLEWWAWCHCQGCWD